jgi:hypothetical protein
MHTILNTITYNTGKISPSSDSNGFRISGPTSYVMTYILPPPPWGCLWYNEIIIYGLFGVQRGWGGEGCKLAIVISYPVDHL